MIKKNKFEIISLVLYGTSIMSLLYTQSYGIALFFIAIYQVLDQFHRMITDDYIEYLHNTINEMLSRELRKNDENKDN